MGSMTRIYARCASPSLWAALRARFPQATIEPPSEFASIQPQDGSRFTPTDGEHLSAELGTETIYLAFSSASESFQFTRCQPGRTLRHIQYGMFVEQGLLEEVTGTAEAWETAAFFDRYAMQAFADIGTDDPEYERIAEIYHQRLIRAGETYPMIDARESARAAATYYRLTDWLEDWMEGGHVPLPVAAPPAPVAAQAHKPWWRVW